VIQLTIVNGKKEGAHSTARRFPVRIGRAQDAGLRLEEEGVWDRHLEIALRSAQGFIVSVQPGAVASINGELIQDAVLRNGDIIDVSRRKKEVFLKLIGS